MTRPVSDCSARRSPRATALGLSLAVAAFTGFGLVPATAQDKVEPDPAVMLGWLELARVQPVDLLMRAKLDSGAKTSAIHAEILTIYNEDDDDGPEGDLDIDSSDAEAPTRASAEGEGDIVVFRLESRRGRAVTLERRIQRYARIKKVGGRVQKRPVVEMEFCIAGVRMTGEVGLTDRDDFHYPILLGRTILADAGAGIDPSATFTHGSRCTPERDPANR